MQFNNYAQYINSLLLYLSSVYFDVIAKKKLKGWHLTNPLIKCIYSTLYAFLASNNAMHVYAKKPAIQVHTSSIVG